MTNAYTVYLVDDDPGALRSLSWLISQAGLPVRAFRSGKEFLNSYRSQEPGCLVLDVQMPEMGGLEVQQRLLEAGGRLPVIFVTAFGDVPTCARAFQSGAIDFLEKPFDGAVLLKHVRGALARVAEQRQRELAACEIAARTSQLTPREKDVLDMLVAGKTLKEIAADDGVRIETIWKHRVAIFRKMKVENEVQLVRLLTE